MPLAPAIIGNVGARRLPLGGPIAYVNDDDIIHIDIAGRRVDVMAATLAIRKQMDAARRPPSAPADRYAAMAVAAILNLEFQTPILS